jgi:3-oxoacyl-[acyl-carrier protein] reductase
MLDIPSQFNLDGQVIVVTGGASGIGASTAEVLSSAGAAVVVGDIDGPGAEQTAGKITADGGRSIGLRTDTSVRADVDLLVDTAVQEYGRLDGMANVAGIGYAKPITEITDADYDRVMNIDLRGVLYGSQAALRVMVPQGSGSIVNVASTVIDSPAPGQALYGMAKSGVAFMSRVLAAEAGPSGIRVNVLAPGSTPTNFASHRYEGGRIDPEREAAVQNAMAQHTPLGFLGGAIDQAMMILFLMSPAARWANGVIWRVNGGQSRPW